MSAANAFDSATTGLRSQLDEAVRIGSSSAASANSSVDEMKALVAQYDGHLTLSEKGRLDAQLTNVKLRAGELDGSLRKVRDVGAAAIDALGRVPATIDAVDRSQKNLKASIDALAEGVRSVTQRLKAGTGGPG